MNILLLTIIALSLIIGGGLFASIFVLIYTAEAKNLWEMANENKNSLEKKLKKHEMRLKVLNEDLDKYPSAELLKLMAMEEHHVKVTKLRLKSEWITEFHDDIRELS